MAHDPKLRGAAMRDVSSLHSWAVRSQLGQLPLVRNRSIACNVSGFSCNVSGF